MSRALGAVYGKFISFGGMSNKIDTKLYNSMLEPVLMHWSGIWRTKSYNVINSVQNKACKYFLSVGKKHFEHFNTRRYGLVIICQ